MNHKRIQTVNEMKEIIDNTLKPIIINNNNNNNEKSKTDISKKYKKPLVTNLESYNDLITLVKIEEIDYYRVFVKEKLGEYLV